MGLDERRESPKMTSPVAQRSLTVAPKAAQATAPKAKAAETTAPASGDRLNIGRPVAAQPQAQGAIKRYATISGTIGGGITGAVLGGFGALIGLSRGHAGLMIGGVAAVGAALGYGLGRLTGHVEEKAVEAVTDDPAKQWSLYLSAGGAMSAARGLKEASALGRGLNGVGALALGGFQLAAETKALRQETKAGKPIRDNQVRVGGAALATLGGAAMLSAALPFAAAVAGPLAIVGGGAALVGFGALVAGRFMDEAR